MVQSKILVIPLSMQKFSKKYENVLMMDMEMMDKKNKDKKNSSATMECVAFFGMLCMAINMEVKVDHQ